jgi:phage shock protein A
MSWIESFTLVMRSSITALRERVEDPERLLNQLIVDMDEELQHVRASVAAAIADEILLKRKVEKARADVDQWEERAGQALKRGDEKSARAALEQKVAAESQVESLTEEHRKQQEQTTRLQASVRDLEDKTRQARQRRTLLLARLARAESSRRINDALDRTESRSAFTQFDRLERRVEREEAMTEAYDRMDGRDPDAEELERKFADEERREKVESQLDELKKRVGERE